MIMRKILSKRLRECKNEKGWNQWETAVYCYITKKAYQSHELMTREPKLEILSKTADKFDVSVDYLIGRTDVKEVNKNSRTDCGLLILSF